MCSGAQLGLGNRLRGGGFVVGCLPERRALREFSAAAYPPLDAALSAREAHPSALISSYFH
jgi:hypothetical protein